MLFSPALPQSRLFRGCLCAAFIMATIAVAEKPSNWPKWRGPNNSGSILDGSYPTKWSKDAPLWKTELPGKGCSTPIVWNQHIIVTAPETGNDAVLAFDWSGKRLWSTLYDKEKPGKHRNGSGCNASPITDGEGIFVYFKSGTLAALDMNGKKRWSHNLVEKYGPAKLFWDHGTSPVLTEKHVIMARMHNGDSWLAAFDKSTGELAWKQPRNYKTPVEGDHGYATPVVIRHKGRESVLVWGAQHLTLHNVNNGKIIWTCAGFNPERKGLWPSIATPVIADGVVLISFGRNDRGIPRLHGIRLGGSGDVTETHRLWVRKDIGTFVPSPISYQGKFYIVGDQGKVECIDPKTGISDWKARFPKHRSKFYGSPLIAAGKIYAPREDGSVLVASIDGEFKLLAENKMGEPVIASPVPSGNRLFIRGINTLFCVSD